jgi:hypothetical protein
VTHSFTLLCAGINDPKLALPGQNSENYSVRVYLNPAPDRAFVSLRIPAGKRAGVTVSNAPGQKVFNHEAELTGRDELYQINTSRFAKGSYCVRVTGEDFSGVKNW